MTSMLRLEIVGVLLLSCTQILSENRDFYGSRKQYGGHRGGFGNDRSHHGSRTREIEVKYGRLRGMVVQPRADSSQLVDVFLGVPYAEPPVGPHRFEPPTTQTPWTGVRHFVSFAPVCPQKPPQLEEEVDPARHQYLERLLPFLQDQSEDCLYLNIYAPHQDNSQRNNLEKFPVMVFIHGESYEWNSGNPYNGSVLAAYGNVVFVTVNFRLGILGFLRPGKRDNTASNFGLLDQIAALAWLQENIGHFGGDPSSVTLVGHGTGAVFVNLLLLSPITDGMFKRAVLMSGSALNPDAIGKAPLQITEQVAHALNCPQSNDDELAACLKIRPVEKLLSVKLYPPKYVPAFAPLIDSAVISDKPVNLMKNAERLARFDLMYGVTELEKFHALPGVALLEGLSNSARDEFIRDSVKATHELEPDLILRKVLEHYKGTKRRQSRSTSGAEYQRNRDLALEVVSDSGVVAPLIATGNLHSRANPKSYMYVFSHTRSIRDDSEMNQQIRRTVHGEELPYVLGVPLGGEGYHLNGPYDKGEELLSKDIMDWWCNFAYYGNPNNLRPPPRRLSHLRDEYKPSSSRYHIDWPEYDPENQTYFNLTTPPQLGRRYRAAEMDFWNEAIPRLLRRPKPGSDAATSRRPRPGLLDAFDHDYANGSFATSPPAPPANVARDNSSRAAGQMPEPPSNLGDGEPDKPDKSDSDDNGRGGSLKNTSAVSLVIGFGVVFLLINATVFVYLYHKRQRMQKKASGSGNPPGPTSSASINSGGGLAQDAAAVALAKKSKGRDRELGYCNSASKPDIRELIKNDKAYDNNSNFGRRSRENSSSTIDTRIKVREWIQQEIVQRCSPRFLRKTRETLQREHREKLMKQQQHKKQQHHLDVPSSHEEAEEELRQRRLDEAALYEESRQIRVRPGVRGAREKPGKVSVAVDATPATRTDSVLNQIPIELARSAPGASSEYLNSFEDAGTILGTSEYCEPAEFQPDELREARREKEAREGPSIVVIEHHHSRSDPLPMDKLPSGSAAKAISTAARINESDSGSASSLYAKINPRMKSRLPVHQQVQQKHLPTDVEVRSQRQQPALMAAGGSTTLPRLLTFGSPPAAPFHSADVNVTNREENVTTSPATSSETAAAAASSSHEEALRTIRRRNYPKVLPDIEKRRSLPPNASFVIGTSVAASPKHMPPPQGHHRQPLSPPSPPPRIYGTSRSLDCVEDRDENEEEDDSPILAVTTNLHVGPLRKKTDSPKNQSVPSLAEASDDSRSNSQMHHKHSLSSATSLPVCPVHGAQREPLLIPGARSEPRIVITPRIECNQESQTTKEEAAFGSIDQLDYPRPRHIPERGNAKLPRIIIKPTSPPNSGGAGTQPRQCKPNVVVPMTNQLHNNETYQRLLARREKMPLPDEAVSTRIPLIRRAGVDAAVTKL
ncbi:uncharacterized protein LOC100121199 isoform X2 [Nasonia vitripennis]|uniref:Carboxylesterase type B domain-containing protein n=1 Tax=Nasonia vitripennis TaxID=7425 RepID=A0A7M7QB73_NASVI|nr:uncharacterized protein LOC100121199 isoform X2 [Nasonia vitripennis]